ncbi:MAG: type II toxin-antitoxin system prevent-host-death family antitoxin [Candidatus Dormibacter sp.]
MERVGVRELRQNASAVLRRVAAGETVEVTDRGHPVARLVPLQRRSALDQMVAEGRATEADGDLLRFRPAQAEKEGMTLSEALAELRSDER